MFQSVLNRLCGWRILCLLVFSLVLPSCLFARQETATVAGTVLDQTGKPVPSAVVVVKNETTAAIQKANTDSDGRFAVNSLASGTYIIEVTAPGFAPSLRKGLRVAPGVADAMSAALTITLNVANLSQTVNVEGAINSIAAQMAPSQSSLDTHSAKSEISQVFIDNFIPPTSDFSEVVLMSPGTFSVNPNGPGLGDSKTYFRGFADGQYTMTFDGIPFNDTNSPTHHSWVFFPAQWIGGTDFDRSPGTASTIGPTNFGGSINLLSRPVTSEPDIRATATYGSFNTRLLGLDYDSGQLGKSSVSVDFHQLLSDGYQTYNYQKRIAGAIKYQYKVSDKTTLSAFVGIIDLWTNTPNTKGPTRAQVAQFGYDYLLSGDPTRPDFYGYNYYHVQTDFAYLGFKTDLGDGWRVDDKLYMYRYWNKQNYNGSTISTTSATDKLNGYTKFGDILAVEHDSARGTFRAGVWYEWAYTDRYQIPTDPRTWVDAALPNFHEHFLTQSFQPFAEYEFRATQRLSITAGIKDAHYNMNLDQYRDNGKTVGNLNGVAFVNHTAGYNSWMPSIDLRYRLKNNWSAYAQFAEGSVIPPSNVFDVKNAVVAVLPKPTTVKTYQVGSVWKQNRFTLDVDAYYSHFQNPYATTVDPATGEPVYYLTSPSNTKGIEAESNIAIGGGLGLYLNGTLGSAKYAKSGLWVANAPRNTFTVGPTYQRKSWDLGFFEKRIGSMYNDNGAVNQAVAIDPFNITNVFINYTIKGSSYLRGSKFRFSIDNLLDKHSIVGVTPASTATSVAAPGDILTLLAGRSFMFTFTPGYAPKR